MRWRGCAKVKTSENVMTKRGKRFRWMWLVAVLLLIISAASAYSVRWYHRFYHHVTHEELSHEVRHSTFPAVIRTGPALELHLYQQENAKNQPLVIFTSGDGGWSPFCEIGRASCRERV